MFSCVFSTRYATGWESEVDTLYLNYGVNWFLQEGQSGFHFSDVATGVASSAVFPGFT